ncbi:MAG: glutamate mutase L [Deltaproteobacteria bacterium]|nr:glutamate mutase L [Deltaproteobacteria bacterium]MBN2674212.1 glutamate mutase L [Deltaproteobacteria bacterium]
MAEYRNEGKVFVITDCGSTTTKAILVEKMNGVYRQTFRGEAPTTVEAPVEDVTVGVKNALADLSALSGRLLIDDDNNIVRPAVGKDGCDMYISTSSAGGGLQMVVLGVVKNISASSALKAALGAGAIVTDCIACDDERDTLEQVERLRKLRPDMVLLAGGTEGGQVEGVVELAELLALAEPKPRFGNKFQLPVVYAGNSSVADEVARILEKSAEVIVEKNVRPTVEEETLSFARDKIHELFLAHVMKQAPGFSKLIALCDAKVMPTPSAVGKMLQLLGRKKSMNVVCVDIGGATTDVFSVVNGQFHRTVSANLGMSYSAAFVLKESGIPYIKRWIGTDISDGELLNQLLNKTIRPTTIPQTSVELAVEHALAREALRLSFAQHTAFAVGLKGGVGERNIDGGFSGGRVDEMNVGDLDWIIGSGGVLSHAPDDMQTVGMLMDSFLPVGITIIAKDSIFMMPHLGVLSEIDEDAAVEVFFNDCIIPLCVSVVPVGKWTDKKKCLSYRVEQSDGTVASGTLSWGDVVHVRNVSDGTLEVIPDSRVNVGAGMGKKVSHAFSGMKQGIVLDARGRPLSAYGNFRFDTVLKKGTR